MQEQATDSKIILAIELGLSTLGESGKQALWFYLNSQGFTPQNVSKDIKGFTDLLKNFFGIGYKFLDSIFCQKLAETTGENLNINGDFVQCVNLVRGIRIEQDNS